MEAIVLDKSFHALKIIDNYISFIWTERYTECGDFELSAEPNLSNIDALRIGHYLRIRESSQIMVIEKVELTTNIEQGSTFLVSGRSLESILARRIIWDPVVVSGGLNDIVKMLVVTNCITPNNANRKINNFHYRDSTDSSITGYQISRELNNRENLLQTITDMCKEADVGIFMSSDSAMNFELYLKRGLDHTYNQSERTYVVFSPVFENLRDTQFVNDTKDGGNCALVLGQGDEGNRAKIAINDSISGLERRELLIDAGSFKKELSNYHDLITQYGVNELRKKEYPYVYEGEAVQNERQKYGKHFFMGDVVQVENEYGLKFQARITEYVRSSDESGYTEYPTFTYVGG